MKKLIKNLEYFDAGVQVLLAALLFAAALVILGISAYNFFEQIYDNYLNAVINLIHELLLIMILLELVATIITYLKERTIPLAPFIIIGIISSLRKLLTIGAQMSISDSYIHTEDKIFNRYLIELGVHTAIVFVLVVALLLVKKYRTPVKQTSTTQRKHFTKNYGSRQPQNK